MDKLKLNNVKLIIFTEHGLQVKENYDLTIQDSIDDDKKLIFKSILK